MLSSARPMEGAPAVRRSRFRSEGSRSSGGSLTTTCKPTKELLLQNSAPINDEIKKRKSFSSLSESNNRRSIQSMSQKTHRWHRAVEHRDVVEQVVDRYFARSLGRLNIDRDDLISVGMEIAAEAGHYAPTEMRSYIFVSVKKGLADYIAGHGRRKTLKRLEFSSHVNPNGSGEFSEPLVERAGGSVEPGFEKVEDTELGQYLFKIAERVIAELKSPNSLNGVSDEEHRDQMRERFRLRFECGMDYQQIASVQGVTMQAVQQSLERIIACVRERMEVEG